jgi:hypothetical protein
VVVGYTVLHNWQTPDGDTEYEVGTSLGLTDITSPFESITNEEYIADLMNIGVIKAEYAPTPPQSATSASVASSTASKPVSPATSSAPTPKPPVQPSTEPQEAEA